MWIGFALTEALALIGIVVPFIFKLTQSTDVTRGKRAMIRLTLPARRRTNPLIPTWPSSSSAAIAFAHRVLRARPSPAAADQQDAGERTDVIEGGLQAGRGGAGRGGRSCSSSTASSSPRPGTRPAGCARRPGSRAPQIIAEMREQAQAEAAPDHRGRTAQIEAERQQALTVQLRGRGRHARDRAGQPDRRRVADRRGPAAPHGGPVPGRARGRPRASVRGQAAQLDARRSAAECAAPAGRSDRSASALRPRDLSRPTWPRSATSCSR